MKGQNLKMHKVLHPTNPFHTCYRIECEGRSCDIAGQDNSTTINICYPAIIITGLPKCGTSAMYEVLAKFPGAIKMEAKENCAHHRRRPHWKYLQSLPRMENLGATSLVIDGCIDLSVNMKMRTILNEPNVQYIVMVRDYADMLWSSYNFWCHPQYDANNGDCGFEKWVQPGVHKRSPGMFHDIMLLDSNGTTDAVQPFTYPIKTNPWDNWYPPHRPVIGAESYYKGLISKTLFHRNCQNLTTVIASEELDAHPMDVALRISNILHFDITGLDLSSLYNKRVNTQDHKGESNLVNISSYSPGLYKASDYKPMLSETRALLNKHWKEDCIYVSVLANYTYAACASSVLEH